MLRLRFDFPDIGVVTVRTAGDPRHVQAHDEAVAKATTGFAREIRLFQRRVLRRYDSDAARAAAQRIYGTPSTPRGRTAQPPVKTRLVSYETSARRLPLIVMPAPAAFATAPELVAVTEPRTAPHLSAPHLSSETP